MDEYRQRHHELEREADDLERQNEHLEHGIEETRRDWESKKDDELVPGAFKPDEEFDAEERESDEETPRPPETEKPPQA